MLQLGTDGTQDYTQEADIATQRGYDTTAYRYPRERLILVLTLLLVFLVIALTATATVCLSAIFVVGAVALSYSINRAHHKNLLAQVQQINPRDTPRLARLVADHVAGVSNFVPRVAFRVNC